VREGERKGGREGGREGGRVCVRDRLNANTCGMYQVTRTGTLP